MDQYLDSRQLLRIAAVGFVILLIVLAFVQGRRGNDAGITAPLGHGKSDALVSGLTRCRTVTLDETASLETCRRFWAENRRQFFAPTKPPPSAAEPLPTSATALGKSQDRFSPTDAKHQQSEDQ